MAAQKKILILHASAGHGHEKAARAVLEAISEKKDGVSVTLLDSLGLMRGTLGSGYRDFYLGIIRYAPWLWGFLYSIRPPPLSPSWALGACP